MSDKIDKEIGKQKFKATRQFIVKVEFEGEAFNQEQFEELIPIELELKDYNEMGVLPNNESDIQLTYEKWWHQPTEIDLSGKVIQLDKTEKIGECIPEADIDDKGNDKLDYSCGTWTNDDFEYLKNEDGTDIKGKE
jgi:hypothetical protein